LSIDCSASGVSLTNTDCNDLDGTVTADQTYYVDGDGDGFGDASNTVSECLSTPSSGNVTDNTDCDDAVATTFPGAAPNDSATACMADEDGDDYGADDAPTGGTAGSDCNDEIDTIKPGVPETCDGTDTNCSGDESDASDPLTFYLDDDGDSFGDASATDEACEAPSDYVADNTDCDDANDTITDSGTGELDTCAATSCLEILDNGYDTGDGSYWIDPDATGAFEAHCDMTIDGGGWTLAWAHDGVTNYNSTSLGYDISSTELYANSIDAMVSYIGSANEMTTTWASFSIPVNWQTSSPMESYQEDTLVDANIGGTLVSDVTLRYGYGDFSFSGSPRNCGSFSWLAGTTSFGTICLDHVDAPNFNGFSVSSGPGGSSDHCSLGTEDPYWNTNCSASLRFAIFVR
jgi:hypothetical protein